jgi:hypothetical protein
MYMDVDAFWNSHDRSLPDLLSGLVPANELEQRSVFFFSDFPWMRQVPNAGVFIVK